MSVVTRKPICLAGVAFLAAGGLTSFLGFAAGQQSLPTFEAYLRKSVVDKRTLDVFLSPKELSWAKFDPVTGYRLGNYICLGTASTAARPFPRPKRMERERRRSMPTNAAASTRT